MRVVIVSDLHLDSRTAGYDRHDDVEEALKQAARHAVDVQADYFIMLGDLCDPDAPNLIRCITTAQEVAEMLSLQGVPSLWLAGNHDVLEDGRGTTTLDPLRFISRVRVLKEPSLYRIGVITENRELRKHSIVALPYTASGFSYDPVQELESMARTVDVDEVTLILSHLMLEGIERGSETEDFPRGRDVFLPIGACKRLFPRAVIVNGHYHRRQTYHCVEIPGSLVRHTRTEVDYMPQFLDIEV